MSIFGDKQSVREKYLLTVESYIPFAEDIWLKIMSKKKDQLLGSDYFAIEAIMIKIYEYVQKDLWMIILVGIGFFQSQNFI